MMLRKLKKWPVAASSAVIDDAYWYDRQCDAKEAVTEVDRQTAMTWAWSRVSRLDARDRYALLKSIIASDSIALCTW